MTRRFRVRQSGFLLPLLAAGMLVAGSAATVVVVQKENVAFWAPKTESVQDLNTIKAALVAFQRANHRLPCVAPRTTLPNVAGYGTELADCTPTGAASGGTVRLNIGGGNFLRIGALPHYTLKLGATAAEDRWGNRFTYAVIEKLVDPYQFTNGIGAIAIQNNAGGALMGTAAWVVVSHGADGKGAYGAKTSSIGKACNATAGKDQGNCLDNDAIFRTADVDTTPGVNFYDDIIAWDNADAYAQTINRPCVRATLGDASWDSNTCINNTWTDMLNGGAQAIVNTNIVASAGSATLGCTNGTLTYAAATCNSHCAAQPAYVWGSPYNCQADIPAVNHGSSSPTINNVVAGRTGTVSAACNDGALTYTTACTPNSCSLPWGGSIAHGGSITAYQSSGVACGSSCNAETRTCSYGVLSGSYTNQTCTSSACGCALPWGGNITHGSSTTAYTSSSVPCGGNCATVAQTRTCNDGNLSGSGDYGSCSVTPCLPCASPCGSIAHGANCTAYQASSVPCGSSCTAETRNCNNGALSGSYTNSSCSVSACAGCASPCGAIIHTGTCTAYLNATEPFGGSCTSQVRTCNNGALSGSYTNAGCSVNPGASCNSPCGVIGHGGTCTAYLNASEPFGGSCTSQVRTCTNGALSGSYTNASCSVSGPASCNSPCGVIGHGANCTAYLNATEPFGGSCTSQVRNCNNGALSGSYTNASCSVAAGGGPGYWQNIDNDDCGGMGCSCGGPCNTCGANLATLNSGSAPCNPAGSVCTFTKPAMRSTFECQAGASCSGGACDIAQITSGCSGCVPDGGSYQWDNVAPCRFYTCSWGTWITGAVQACAGFCQQGP